jgi:hypothetical protein
MRPSRNKFSERSSFYCAEARAAILLGSAVAVYGISSSADWFFGHEWGSLPDHLFSTEAMILPAARAHAKESQTHVKRIQSTMRRSFAEVVPGPAFGAPPMLVSVFPTLAVLLIFMGDGEMPAASY